MSAAVLDQAASFALWIALKASVLLGIAALVQAVMRGRASAATRHMMWTFVVASVLLLPLASLALPSWTPARRVPTVLATEVLSVTQSAAEGRATEEGAAVLQAARDAADPAQSAPPEGRWLAAAVGGVYAAGVLIMCILFALDRRRIRRLASESTQVHDGEWVRLLDECTVRIGTRRAVRLLRSRERSMPMTFGTRSPTIIIPAIGDTWSDDRRRAVLLHELAHVARCDCFTQTIAFAACLLYWFHPGVWWSARRLRVERELACDDRAIAAGSGSLEYANHLLEIAYAFGSFRAPALAVSMARAGQLEGRMLAALDTERNRRPPAWRGRMAGAALAAILLLPVASATPAIVSADPDWAKTPSASGTTVTGPSRREALRSASPVTPAAPAPRGVLALVAGDGQGGAAPDGAGTWEIRPSGKEGTVHLRMTERNSSSGRDVTLKQFDGLSAAQLTGAGGPVQFRVRRDAGTFAFEGVLRNGIGAGTYSFTPDPAFPAELAKRGLAAPTPAEQYELARSDVGYAFLDELNAQGYSKPATADLVRAGHHGVDGTFVRELGALGHRLGSLAPLIELRDHGVTPAYIRELAEEGYKGLSVDELRTARDHGVSVDFVHGMRAAGYKSLTMEQLVNARDHGVSAEFASELGAAGYSGLTIDTLIRVRDHGVSAEYAREMRQMGQVVSLDALVSARDHGVSAEFAREMAALGYTALPIDSLIRVRDHGVTPAYARELKSLGYEQISIDELVMLRDHGVTPERVRAANARAGKRLPIDVLTSLADRGM
jgi:beta-lactamase regulating signal transducer with metallopeptidase domain